MHIKIHIRKAWRTNEKENFSTYAGNSYGAFFMACGSSDESKEEDKYEKYEVLLSYLEKENYEQAYKELERIEERNTAAKENAEAEAKDEKDKQDEDDEDPSVIDFAKVERDEEGYVKLTEAQFKGLFEVVEITTENWSEYFEDYEYTEHNEDVNSFGEVEREWDTVHHVFGLKQGIYANLKDIAFKFAGRKVVSDYVAWDSETGMKFLDIGCSYRMKKNIRLMIWKGISSEKTM